MRVRNSKEFLEERVLLERIQIPRLCAKVAGVEYGTEGALNKKPRKASSAVYEMEYAHPT